MIPILYSENSTSFDNYGIGALADTISCEVTEERNGAYELVLKYPVTGIHFGEIKNERLIKAKPNDTSQSQAFRIYRISTPLKGIVTVYAQHISYDLIGIPVPMWSSHPMMPQLAMNYILSSTLVPHNFTFGTDFTLPQRVEIKKPKNLRAVIGGSDGSFLDIWGGEFEWDNFDIIQHKERGADNGVIIEYGKNLTDLNQDSDISEIYTDLLPFAVNTDEDGNETVVTLYEQTLPITNTELKQKKILIKDFTDSFKQGETISDNEVRLKAKDYIRNNPLGVETPSLTISFAALWKQLEYPAILERVSLCDTVTVRHINYGVSVKQKVIKTVYDCLLEKYVSITLGVAKANFVNSISDAKAEIKQVTQTVDRIPTLMSSAINNATKLITGNKGGYVVLHGNSETSMPYELLVLDQPNIEDAVNVWRWNVNGLGFSSHGYNGPYETAITSDGKIVADFISTGTLVANIIKAGVLSSNDGSSYWDLESGEVVLNAYASKEDLGGVATNVSNIENKQASLQQSVNGLTSSVSSITGRVGTLEGDVDNLEDTLTNVETNVSTLQQTATQISADVLTKADKAHGDVNSSFGWKLDSSGFEVYSNKNTVMKASPDGLDVAGRITSSEGTIGGFTINANSISAGTPGSESGIEITSTSLTGYKSSNQGVHSSYCISKLVVNKAMNLSIYIRSYAESTYDYMIASTVNAENYPTNYNDETAYANTRGNQNNSTKLSSYTRVDYQNLKAGDFIYIVFRKDSSGNVGDDAGYLLIPDATDTSLYTVGAYGFERYSTLDIKGASISVGTDFSVDHKGTINSTSGKIGNLTISKSGLRYDGSWDARFEIGSLSTDTRMPSYAIYSRTQRIDNCIMGLKSNAYGENFWVEFKPEGYCVYMSSDAEDATLIGKIPYGEMRNICWLNSTLGSMHTDEDATCPQIIVFNATVSKSSYSTIDLSIYGINEIIGASITELDTNDTGSNNQWCSISGKSITIHNTTTKQKTYSTIIIAV